MIDYYNESGSAIIEAAHKKHQAILLDLRRNIPDLGFKTGNVTCEQLYEYELTALIENSICRLEKLLKDKQ